MEYEKMFTGEGAREKYQTYFNNIEDLSEFALSRMPLFFKNIRLVFDRYLLYDPKGLEREIYEKKINFIDKAVYICEKLNNIKIDPKVFKTLDFILNEPTFNQIDYLIPLYRPQLMKDNIPSYLGMMHSLIFNHSVTFVKMPKTGHNLLNDIYGIIAESYGKNWNEIYDARRMLTIIIGYLHMNNLYDHERFMNYINNIKFYDEKLELNGIAGAYLFFNDEDAKYLFSNFDSFFDEERVEVR